MHAFPLGATKQQLIMLRMHMPNKDKDKEGVS